jgi:hypothetical protein
MTETTTHPGRRLIMSVSPEQIADLKQRFAADLERLRVSAGITSLRALARSTHYSHTSITDAVGGKKFPSLEVAMAFVTACGGDVGEWRQRWTYTYAVINEPAALASPWPKQEVADGNDPMDAGCYADAVTVRAAKVSLAARRHIIGLIELRHSRRTHAAWGRFRGEQGLDMLAMHRHRVDLTVGVACERGDRRLGYLTEYGFDHHWGDLLLTGRGALFAWVTVRFDGDEVAYCETDRAELD